MIAARLPWDLLFSYVGKRVLEVVLLFFETGPHVAQAGLEFGIKKI